ncbi:MAG TPA: hypothetical protein VH134_03110 [Candidatus Dormibacteraeota bacterium]|nr:hypothetical protein [Candidatus Dormibacteraeota bacterium]
MVQEERVDVGALVAEVEAEVARRRAAGDYPEELLTRLRTEFAVEEESEPPEALAIVESSRPLRSTRPVVGPAVVFGKRALRRLLSWYVHPAVHDQNRFNLALLRELRDLQARLERLERQAEGDGDEAHG